MRAADEALVASPHLSWFQQHGQVHAYHDLFGYLLAMSPDVAELIEHHRGAPRTRADVEEAFAGRFEPGQLDEFLPVLELFSCLVPPGAREEDQLWVMVPVPARWVVAHQPAPDRLTFWRTGRDGHSTSEEAPPWAARLWGSIDGAATLQELVAELAAEAGEGAAPRAAVEAMVASWVHHERQYLRFSKVPVARFGPEHQWPSYLRSSMPFAPWDPRGPLPPDPFEEEGVPIAPPHGYYAGEVSDPAAQFEDLETTLSHLLRGPTPLLGGSTYAERVTEALLGHGMLGAGTRRILEVGAGTGDLAAGVLGTLRRRAPEIFAGLAYTIVDLSPALREAQAERLARDGLAERVHWVHGNAETLPLPADSVDLVLCNEVIGDFTTVRLTRALLGTDVGEDAPPDAPWTRWDDARLERLGEVGDLIRRWELPLDDAPPDMFLNIGALRFLGHLHRILRPGGAAFVTEYGDAVRYPVAGTHLDHLEFSVHFGHMLHVADRVGFDATLEYVQDLIGLDREARTLASTRTWFASLRALFASVGLTLDKRAWTREMLEELVGDRLRLDDISGLRYHPVDERCMGLSPHEFKALLLRKPA